MPVRGEDPASIWHRRYYHDSRGDGSAHANRRAAAARVDVQRRRRARHRRQRRHALSDPRLRGRPRARDRALRHRAPRHVDPLDRRAPRAGQGVHRRAHGRRPRRGSPAGQRHRHRGDHLRRQQPPPLRSLRPQRSVLPRHHVACSRRVGGGASSRARRRTSACTSTRSKPATSSCSPVPTTCSATSSPVPTPGPRPPSLLVAVPGRRRLLAARRRCLLPAPHAHRRCVPAVRPRRRTAARTYAVLARYQADGTRLMFSHDVDHWDVVPDGLARGARVHRGR